MGLHPTAAAEQAAARQAAEDFGADALHCIHYAHGTPDEAVADFYAALAGRFARWAWRAAADSQTPAVIARLGFN